jgi:hypothetical protein
VLACQERSHVRNRALSAAPRQVDRRDVVEWDSAQEGMDCKAEAPQLLPRDAHPLGPAVSGGVEEERRHAWRASHRRAPNRCQAATPARPHTGSMTKTSMAMLAWRTCFSGA